MSSKVKVLLSIVVVAFGVWFYFTPHLAVRAMKAAADVQDAARLSSYVDFAALKADLKSSLSAKLVSHAAAGGENNPLQVAGAAMATAIVDPMIDALITPENLALMMEGAKTHPAGVTKPTAKHDSGSRESSSETSTTYEGFNRFVVTVKHKGSDATIGLIFQRNGLFAWKLSGLRLPM